MKMTILLMKKAMPPLFISKRVFIKVDDFFSNHRMGGKSILFVFAF